MASSSSKVWSSNTPAMVPLLFFFLTVITVKGVSVVSNVGENITLTCNPNRFTGNLFWSRGISSSQCYFAAVDTNYPSGGIYNQYRDKRLSQLYEVNNITKVRSFTIYINDARITDSTRYTCIQEAPPYREEYDVRVIECSTCLINPRQGLNPQEVEVNCHLNDFSVSEPKSINITLNDITENVALIEGSNLTFSTSSTMIYNDIKVDFNPFGDTSSYITCIVPAKLTTPSSVTVHTTSESGKSASRKMNATILIIIIVGSIFLIILLAIILVLRYKKTRRGNQTKLDRLTTNDSTVDKATVEGSGSYYESIKGTSPMGPGVNTVLQDSTNAIIQSSSLRRSGELDTVLYTLPDKSGIINRVAKSKVVMDDFTSSAIISCNTAITSDNELERDLPKQMNPYEEVDIPGSRAEDDCRRIPLYATPEQELVTNDGEDIPMYAMPDKGPESTMKAVKATPGGNDGGEFPLYAMPDTGPGPTGNNAKAASGPETLLDDDGEKIPLAAILDKGPGSTENNVEATSPGLDQTENRSDAIPLYALPSKGPRSNKDEFCSVDAMYAEVK